MKYHFNADNHKLAWVVVLVNGFGSASFMDMVTFIVETPYSGHWDGPRASCPCSAGIIINHIA